MKKKPSEKMGDGRTLADDAAGLFEQGESVDYIIAFLTGVLTSMEKFEPYKTYSVAEVHELFEMLCILRKKERLAKYHEI